MGIIKCFHHEDAKLFMDRILQTVVDIYETRISTLWLIINFQLFCVSTNLGETIGKMEVLGFEPLTSILSGNAFTTRPT